MKRTRVLTLALIALSFAGCQGDQKAKDDTVRWLQSEGMDAGSATLLVNNKPALRRYLMDRGMARQDDAYCRSLGAQPGSSTYVQCRTSVSGNRPVNDPPPAPQITIINRPQQLPPEMPAWPTKK